MKHDNYDKKPRHCCQCPEKWLSIAHLLSDLQPKTQNVEEYARRKREQKQLDLICANDDVSLKMLVLMVITTHYTLSGANGETRLPHSSKTQLSHRLPPTRYSKHYDEKIDVKNPSRIRRLDRVSTPLRMQQALLVLDLRLP